MGKTSSCVETTVANVVGISSGQMDWRSTKGCWLKIDAPCRGQVEKFRIGGSLCPAVDGDKVMCLGDVSLVLDLEEELAILAIKGYFLSYFLRFL